MSVEERLAAEAALHQELQQFELKLAKRREEHRQIEERLRGGKSE